jgi:hypothetical protein
MCYRLDHLEIRGLRLTDIDIKEFVESIADGSIRSKSSPYHRYIDELKDFKSLETLIRSIKSDRLNTILKSEDIIQSLLNESKNIYSDVDRTKIKALYTPITLSADYMMLDQEIIEYINDLCNLALLEHFRDNAIQAWKSLNLIYSIGDDERVIMNQLKAGKGRDCLIKGTVAPRKICSQIVDGLSNYYRIGVKKYNEKLLLSN